MFAFVSGSIVCSSDVTPPEPGNVNHLALSDLRNSLRKNSFRRSLSHNKYADSFLLVGFQFINFTSCSLALFS